MGQGDSGGVLSMPFLGFSCVVFDFGGTLSSDLYFNVIPPDVDDWHPTITREIFEKPEIVGPWMCGDLSLLDISEVLAAHMDYSPTELHDILRQGCRRLSFNQPVYNLAVRLAAADVKTALVTGNFDVFSDVIVPEHDLDSLFDAIVNSSDHGTYEKIDLWPVAFERFGFGVGYENSLLIEDTEYEIAHFRERGGTAHRYIDDESFSEWLKDAESNGRADPAHD
jgi:hypothetical protein